MESIAISALSNYGLPSCESEVASHANCSYPVSLPDCGHTFCQQCLQDWFSTTLSQHKSNHPQYNIAQQPQVPYYLSNLTGHIPFTAAQRTQLANIFPPPIPHPTYTCPKCRVTVGSKPIESFALKSLVNAVAKLQGEKSPTKSSTSKSRGRKGAQTRKDGPWDQFFR